MSEMAVDSMSLAYCYGCRNAGDYAINEGTLSLIDRTAPDTAVDTVSRFEEGTAEFWEVERKLDSGGWDANLVGGPISYDPRSQSQAEQVLSLLRDGLTYSFDLSGTVPDSRLHSGLHRQITDSDALLYNGGNAIHYSPSHQSLAYLLAVLYPLQIARYNDVPYGILPQTIFGLDGVAERLVVPILDDAVFVMTRDAETYRYLSGFDLSTQVIDAVDTAFLCGRPSVGTGPTADPKEIAVVPRFSTLGDTGALDRGDDRMREIFFRYLRWLTDAGHDVVLTIQTEIDRRWAAQNREQLDAAGASYWSSFEPAELRSHYADVDLLVTMRLHAGIFALSMGTPAIGVYRSEWGPKIAGTWEMLGIERFALSWEAATIDRLTGVTEDAIANRETLSTDIESRVSEANERLSADFRTVLVGD